MGNSCWLWIGLELAVNSQWNCNFQTHVQGIFSPLLGNTRFPCCLVNLASTFSSTDDLTLLDLFACLGSTYEFVVSSETMASVAKLNGKFR